MSSAPATPAPAHRAHENAAAAIGDAVSALREMVTTAAQSTCAINHSTLQAYQEKLEHLAARAAAPDTNDAQHAQYAQQADALVQEAQAAFGYLAVPTPANLQHPNAVRALAFAAEAHMDAHATQALSDAQQAIDACAIAGGAAPRAQSAVAALRAKLTQTRKLRATGAFGAQEIKQMAQRLSARATVLALPHNARRRVARCFKKQHRELGASDTEADEPEIPCSPNNSDSEADA